MHQRILVADSELLDEVIRQVFELRVEILLSAGPRVHLLDGHALHVLHGRFGDRFLRVFRSRRFNLLGCGLAHINARPLQDILDGLAEIRPLPRDPEILTERLLDLAMRGDVILDIGNRGLHGIARPTALKRQEVGPLLG